MKTHSYLGLVSTLILSLGISASGVDYFINDLSTSNDVYCSAIGSDANSGTNAAAPMLTLTNLLATKDLEPGDTVYIDTGIYTNTATITSADEGSPLGFVTFQGSTNDWSIGTVFAGTNKTTHVPLTLNGPVNYLRFRNIKIQSAYRAFYLANARFCTFENLAIFNCGEGIYTIYTTHSNFYSSCAFVSNSLAFNLGGGVSATRMERSVLYNNTRGIYYGANISISNSILSGGNEMFLNSVPANAGYNLIWTTNIGVGYDTLASLQKATGGWKWATVANPQFAAPGSLDLHLKSLTGRYSPSTGSWVTDSVHSVAIDFGNPLYSAANEPEPNGGRLNAGVYGNSWQASKSRTNLWLFALSYNDGGTLSAPMDSVYWNGNLTNGETVRIELSGDAGASWNVAETGLLASARTWQWSNTNLLSSKLARWRVVYEANTNVYDACDTNFIFKTAEFRYYVNDASTSGDIYCTAAGATTNAGTTPGAPKSTLQAVWDEQDLEPGDVIFVDTGTYNLSANPTMGAADGGDSNAYVFIRGSTNGTVFVRNNLGSTYALFLNNADYVEVSNIELRRAGTGIYLASADNVNLTGVRAVSNATAGISLNNSQNVRMNRSVTSLNSGNGVYLFGASSLQAENCVLWRNGLAGLRTDIGAAASISNSVVAASGLTAYGYYARSAGQIAGNYNDIHTESNAVAGYLSNIDKNIDNLSEWIVLNSQEWSSLSTDPLFANPQGGDFHLKTQTPLGRYVKGLGFATNDAVTSPLIDAGNPAEAAPVEGNRKNIGLYGNSAEASIGRSNPWIRAATFEGGGIVSGMIPLHWVAVNTTNGTTVSLEASVNGGDSWFTIASGIPATNETYSWNTAATNDTPSALLRVVCPSVGDLYNEAGAFFRIRNSGVSSYYVNDANPADDMYTTAVGATNNWFATSNAPMNSLARLLDLFNLEPGDRVYVDSGSYTSSANAIVSRLDSGMTTNPVIIQGSAHEPLTKTVINRADTGADSSAMQLLGAEDVIIRNLRLEGAYTGIRADSAGYVTIEQSQFKNNASSGLYILNSSSVFVQRVVSEANGGWGLQSSASSVGVQHSLIWSNTLGAVSRAGGSMAVYNNILGAAGSGSYVFSADASSGFASDYNNILMSDLARMADYDYEVYPYLISWRDKTGNDARSLSHNPGFFNAAVGDYHLTSPAGRYLPGSGFVTNAAESFSVLIDAGNPLHSAAAEPSPNGGRVNIGLYGASVQASKTPETNGWLTVLTLNNGGTLRGTNTLYWLAGGIATGHTYTLQVSLNNGATWTNVVTNLTAGTDSYTWNSSLWGSSAETRWRIVSEINPAIFGTNDTAFLLDNGALTFYVNDTNLVGDVYTTAAGSAFNSGLASNKPKASIQDVLQSYSLKAGDKILVDTGTYALNSDLAIGSSSFGYSTNPIVIQGSTNFNSAGTVLNRQGGSYGFYISDTEYIQLKHFTIQNAQTAVQLDGANNCLVDSVKAIGGSTAFSVNTGTSNAFLNCLARNATSRGLYARRGTPTLWQNGVLWSNAVGVYMDEGSLTFRNSMIGAFGSSSYAYYNKESAATNQISADYNNIWLQNGAKAAYFDAFSGAADDRIYETVSRWSRDTGRDAHSLSHDPGFCSSAAGDFHLLSPAGRFLPGSGFVTNAEAVSVMIDAGSPVSAFTNEPSPNGGRVNIGMYGNTAQASKTPTNSILTAVSLNDGGRVEGVKDLIWVASGDVTGHTVTIEFSANGGASWTTLVSGISASAGSYSWDTTAYPSTPLGIWRITSDTDPSVSDETETLFAVRNGPLSFYVNDVYTNGDVFCSRTGSVERTGVVPDDPKADVQDVLDTYDLEPGDTIYVDTGSYTPATNMVIGVFDVGAATNRVAIRGSPNRVWGGTVFGRYGFNLTSVQGIELRDLVITTSTVGVYANGSAGILLDGVETRGCTNGFRLTGSGTRDFTMRHCAAIGGQQGLYVENSAAATWENGLLWSNTYGAYVDRTGVDLRNTVIGALKTGQYAYYFRAGSLTSDYNVIFLTNGAYAGYAYDLTGDRDQQNLSRWVRAIGVDAHSLSHDPGFYSAASNDFHALSPAGRYVAGTGYITNAAEVVSVLIDSGDPLSSAAGETEPSGARINIGRYGGTAEASLSPTNSRLIAVSLNDGGRVEGTKVLTWVAAGDATGHTVKIEYSFDAGTTWTTMVAGVAASDETWTWDTTLYPSTPVGIWRVVSESDGSVFDQTDNIFAVRNEPLFYYVNDASALGDVYCSATGGVGNTGAFACAPKTSVQDVINTYDLEPGDTIYVDTGIYPLTANIQPSVFDMGSGSNRISIVGSTNYAAGGSVLTGYGIDLNGIGGWAFRHLTIAGAAKAICLLRSDNVRVEWVRALNGSLGFEINTGYNAEFRHCVAAGNTAQGVYNRRGYNTVWDHGVVWSNLYGIHMDEGSMQVRNTVIGAFGSGRYAYYYRERAVTDVFDCDYNDIYMAGGAYAGLFHALAGTDYNITYENASRWARDFGQDQHSLSHDPLFADPAAGDFHLKSPAGRYVTGTGYVTNSADDISLLIDAGSPLSGYSDEPQPNGGRINIGLYGNTCEASKTPTNSVLTAVSLSSGGRVEGVFNLVWSASGDATGHTVTIEYSANGGASWTTLASGVSASLNAWSWDTSLVPDSMLGMWRITSEDDPAVTDTNNALFAVRNAPIAFYVNDLGISGDIYCSVVGNSTNNGLSPSEPQSSLQYILDTYDLEPGDTVYVDVGNYTVTAQITVPPLDSGSATNHMIIQGSTSDVNRTIFTVFGATYGFSLDQVTGVALKNMTVRNASIANIYFNKSLNSEMRWLISENCGRDGFRLRQNIALSMNHCIARANNRHGVYNELSTGTEWVNGVLWSNESGVSLEGGSLKVENTVLAALNAQQQAFRYLSGTMTSDYNDIYRANGGYAGVVIVDGIYSTRYDSVSAWNAAVGYDEHSLSVDPGFWNASGGDYHLKSPAGRYLPGTGFVTNIAEVASLLLDAGNPSSPVGEEPVPNGGRVNIGLYGGTGQASMTSTSAVLSVSSLNDGGYATGTVSLIWLARGAATGHTVYIEFSGNGGVTWTTLVSGISASLESWTWDTTLQVSTPIGLWRITSIEDPLVSDQSETFFSIRNSPFSFYVNDNSTTGDVYTLVKGSAVNSGLTPAEPKASIQDVLDSYDLEAGDAIWVDTGTYALSSDLAIGALDGGRTNLPVVIRGSANAVFGGSVLDRQVTGGGAVGIRVNNVQGLLLKDLLVKRAEFGVVFENASRNCRAEGITSLENGSAGFVVHLSSDIVLANCLAYNNSYGLFTSGGLLPTTLRWENGVIWESGTAVWLGNNTESELRNSFLQGRGSGNRAIYISQGALLTADYNNYSATNGAILVEKDRVTGGNEVHDYLSSWVFASGQDVHSLSHAPLFADPGNRDFHLKSSMGRYETGTGYATNDAPGTYSPMLDTGDPSSVYTNETSPNGQRINMGLYGNTPQSSLSRTNEWLLAITLNDSGVISGTQDVYWTYGNIGTGETVKLEYSLNGGIEFFTLATNIPVSQESYSWDVTLYNNTPRGLWRVALESNPLVYDVVDNEFSIRNQARQYYVNDTNTAGDVYTSVPGSMTNTGLTADSPMDSPLTVMKNYAVLAGDEMFIDTGVYVLTNDFKLGILNRGLSGMPIRITGSTNVQAGGTVLDRNSTNKSTAVIELENTSYVELEHLRLTGAGRGVLLDDSLNCSLSWIEVYDNLGNGFDVFAGSPYLLTHCLAVNNGGWGISVQSIYGAAAFSSGVIWSNGLGSAQAWAGFLSVSNSILHASGTNAVYELNQLGLLNADYNVLWPVDGALVGRDIYRKISFRVLQDWQRNRNQDTHSLRSLPGFADELNGDFHLKTDHPGGRYVPATGVWTSDTEVSWAIDAGDFAADFENEPGPNGGRLNAGLYGNTWQASRTSTNVHFKAVSLNDGGSVSGPFKLYWLVMGMATDETIRLEFSIDGGFNWDPIATNVNPYQNGYLWDPSAFGSTPNGYWRVVSETDTNRLDSTDTNFLLRVGSVTFYVNDTNTAGDVYCAGPGDESYTGLSPLSPMLSLQTLLDTYDIAPGDAIYIDTGYYPLDQNLVINSLDSGVATSRVQITGAPDRGTIFDRGDTTNENTYGIVFNSSSYVTLSNVVIRNADTGVDFFRSDSCILSDSLVGDCGDYGVRFYETRSNRLQRTVVVRSGDSGIRDIRSAYNFVDGSVVWDSGTNAILATENILCVSNSVLHARGIGSLLYSHTTNGQFIADYNDLYVQDGAFYGKGPSPFALIGEGLPQWILYTTQDVHSLSFDPAFADPDNDDFHPKSPEGRYEGGIFVQVDTIYSPLIDAGSPNTAVINEPMPNGGRMNIGAYGNTVQASKSRTNAWILAVYASAGGRVAGGAPVMLTWLQGNLDPTNRVTLEYSCDNGITWTNIISGIPVTDNEYLWSDLDDIKYLPSPTARWRVFVEAIPSIVDDTDVFFSMKGPFTYYLNDLDTSNDVFTVAVGDDANLGIAPTTPKLTLSSVVSEWDIQGGDTIVMDTGTYIISNEVVFAAADAGELGAPVTLQGSTNAGGTVLRFSTNNINLVRLDADHLDMEDVTLNGGWLRAYGDYLRITGITLTNDAVFDIASYTTTVMRIAQHGGYIRLQNSAEVVMRHLRMKNARVMISGSSDVLMENALMYGTSTNAVAVSDTQRFELRNSTLAVSGNQFLQQGASLSDIENNIMIADGPTRFCILQTGGALNSDYNNLVTRNGAWFGNAEGQWEKLIYWQEESGLDAHSLPHEPLFVNEAAGDYHLQSYVGSWNGTGWSTNANHSPAIDAGNPSTVFTNEPYPRGPAVNMGAYGGTEEASKSRLDPWLLALTVSDGGVLTGTNTIYWLSGNLTTNTLQLAFTSDGGTSWVTIASGISAALNEYVWDTTAFITNSMQTYWRVMVEANTNIFDETDEPFSVRNGPIYFYINDNNTTGDVFCGSVGNDANDGLTTNTPMRTLTNLLARYDLEGFDTVFIDAGYYKLNAQNAMIWSDAGREDIGSLLIQGAGTGTVFSGWSKASAADALRIYGNYIILRDFAVSDAGVGILMPSNRFVTAEGLLIVSNALGIKMQSGANCAIVNSLFLYNTNNAVALNAASDSLVENNTFYGNIPAGISVTQAVGSILQNNIFVMTDAGATAYGGSSNDVAFNVGIDYNVYYFEQPGYIYGIYNTLLPWQLAYRKDYRSAVTNPLFASVADGDFHLQSAAGRYVPGTGFVTTDTNTSWAIDKGDPDSDNSLEPEVNGDRINIGRYGGTPEASKGSTNAFIYARSLNDPVFITATNSVWPLIWHALNLPTGTLVTVQYSGDGGITWHDIAAGLNAYQEYVIWQPTYLDNSYSALWRVIDSTNAPVYVDTNDAEAALFFGTFEITESKRATGTNLHYIVWRGAWNEEYRVQYSYGFTQRGDIIWSNCVDGVGTNQIAHLTNTVIGGDFRYEDPQSQLSSVSNRLYRVWWDGP